MPVANFDFFVAEGVLFCVEEAPRSITESRSNGIKVGVVEIPEHGVAQRDVEFDGMLGADRDGCGFSLSDNFFARGRIDLGDYCELLLLRAVVLNVHRVVDLRRVSRNLRANLLTTH